MYHSENQAEILNKQFQNLSDVLECSGLPITPSLNVAISLDGVKMLLSTLDSSKLCGPDNIPPSILSTVVMK